MTNIPFDILTEGAEEILIKVALEVKRRCPGVWRIRLGEVWASPCCKTFCKLGVINKEHQFRDAADPLRRPIEGTEKGDLGKEAEELVKKTLLLIVTLACMKGKQGWPGESMQVVEGIELDLRGMEWFMENPVGMLAMQDYMLEFEQSEVVVVRWTIDYCAWKYFYMKPTHMWTRMVFWNPKGDQKGGTGRCILGVYWA